ncbi:MAG TPA: ABC transporter substrate-binding protein, partial [Rummeliibacillus sp.]|nr:ABC transporter substrate-binding protein [Rummeliibacillus sp.]
MRKWFVYSLMLIILVVLSACGKDSTSNEGESSNSGEKQSSLVYGRGTDSVSLDPITVTDGESFKVARNIYETLVQFGEEDTSIKPSLAKEWKISKDQLTYTFKLQEGVKFHDGTDFNAEAVVKNFERWMNGSVDQFPYYGDMFGGFKGDKNHIIDSVKAVDDTTFELKLKKPAAALLNNLAMTAFSIASPTAIKKEGDKYGENPVGTGPFKFVSWKRNNTIELEKNSDYWQKGYPKVSKLIYRTLPDNSARLNSLVTGEIDIADGLSPSDHTRIEQDQNLQLLKRPSFNVGYLGMTMTQKPFDDTKVREAVSMAIDRQAIVNSFFEGFATEAKNPLQPTALGYNKNTEQYNFDVEKAKSLLKESSYDGKVVELWAMPVPRPYMPDGQKVAEAIQKNLESIGMKTKIVTYEWATYLEKTRKGEAQLFLLGGTSDNGDPDNLLSLFFYDSGSLNNSQLHDEKIQKWLAEARSTTDHAKREAIYADIQNRLREIIPVLPLVHSTPIVGARSNVKNYQPHPT